MPGTVGMRPDGQRRRAVRTPVSAGSTVPRASRTLRAHGDLQRGVTPEQRAARAGQPDVERPVRAALQRDLQGGAERDGGPAVSLSVPRQPRGAAAHVALTAKRPRRSRAALTALGEQGGAAARPRARGGAGTGGWWSRRRRSRCVSEMRGWSARRRCDRRLELVGADVGAPARDARRARQVGGRGAGGERRLAAVDQRRALRATCRCLSRPEAAGNGRSVGPGSPAMPRSPGRVVGRVGDVRGPRSAPRPRLPVNVVPARRR